MVSETGSDAKPGFETRSLQLKDHPDRGVGGRQYGSSEDIETLQGKSNASGSRFGAVEECGSSLTGRSQFARIVRPCHRRIHRMVLFRTASGLKPNCRPALPVLSRTEEPSALNDQCALSRGEASRL